MGVGTYGDKSFDTIEDRTVLEYRKGRLVMKLQKEHQLMSMKNTK